MRGYGTHAPIRDEYLIVDRGRLGGVGAHSYSEGMPRAGVSGDAPSRGDDPMRALSS